MNMEVNVEAGCGSMINSSSFAEINKIPKDRVGRDSVALLGMVTFGAELHGVTRLA